MHKDTCKLLTANPNTTNGQQLEQHTLEIPPCCPVSKNPRPGSTITIRYRPHGASLEVATLVAYIHSYRGGLYDVAGQLLVRDMEGMLVQIAQDCADVLGVAVRVSAQLVIVPRQQVSFVVRGYPSKERA